jgi:LysM repeat protein
MADQVPGTATDGAYGLYPVQRGDTLSSVAVRYDTSVEELMRLNGLSGSHWLYVGQQLRVPMR